MTELQVGLLLEGIKAVAAGGITAFRKIIGQPDELIQLNIADIAVPVATLEGQDLQTLHNAIKNAPLVFEQKRNSA